MRHLVAAFVAAGTIVLIGSSLPVIAAAGPDVTGAAPRIAGNESCVIQPFTWNIVASAVRAEGRLVRVDYLATGVARHTGSECPLAGDEISVLDRAYVLFDMVCGPDGTTSLRGRDPLEYGSGWRMEFRGPITGTVTCGGGETRNLDMEIQAKSPMGANLLLHMIGQVDLGARALTSLAVTDGELVFH